MTTVRRRHSDELTDPTEIAVRLRAEGHTVGSTRRAIVEAVCSSTDAVTAEQLATALDNVHVATVYRTLAILEELGVVTHVHVSHGPALYELARLSSGRRHLVCDVCGRHLSVPVDVFDQARHTLEAEHGFLLHGSHFAIVGQCTDCNGADRRRP